MNPTSRPGSSLARFWPFLIPVLWCIGCQWVLDPHGVTYADEVPFALKVAIYDESDLTAMALRGLNSRLGRLPGRPDEPAWHQNMQEFVRVLRANPPRTQDRYYLEYPTTALVLFRLGYPSLSGVQFPTAVTDGQQFWIAHHRPQEPQDLATWGALNKAVRIYLVEMTVGLLLLMAVLMWGYGTADCPSGPIWLLALPGAVYFGLNRFDVWPALATAMAFACLGRRWLFWGGAFLAFGVLLKVYPVVMLPIILRYLGLRDGFKCLLGFTFPMLCGVGLSILLLDWEATIAPIRIQLNRPVEEYNWIFYGRLLPFSLAYSKTARTAILVLTILAMCLIRPGSLSSVLKRCIVVVLVFNSMAVFWSPQWIIWYLPLMVPLARKHLWILLTVISFDLINYFSFPVLFWGLFTTWPHEFCSAIVESTIYLRGFLNLGVLAGLAWVAWSRSPWHEKRLLSKFSDLAPQHESKFLLLLQANPPRGLNILGVEQMGEATFARSVEGELIALQPMQVKFEPVVGGELEDVPQASEPRLVTALMKYDGGWQPVKAVFNLSPEQVLEKSAGQLRAM